LQFVFANGVPPAGLLSILQRTKREGAYFNGALPLDWKGGLGRAALIEDSDGMRPGDVQFRRVSVVEAIYE
jgi:hypothetical protein